MLTNDTIGDFVNGDDSWKKRTNRQILEQRVADLHAEVAHWEQVLRTFNPSLMNMTQEESRAIGVNIHFHREIL